MNEVTRERLLALPKAELHVHLDGSLRPETMVEFARTTGTALPASEPTALQAAMSAEEAGSLEAYLRRFELTLSLLQSAEALERAAYELTMDSAAENVRYLEVRFSPILNTREGLRPDEVLEAALAGLRAAEEEAEIRTALIVCALRDMEPSVSEELAELAVGFGDRGVVAFDLAGAERGNPPRPHARAFRIAVDGGLSVTVHAGEAAGPDSVREALEEGRADRIGHGTLLYEDPDLMRLVKTLRIPLEVCLTSNVQTGAVKDFASHPLRRYYDEGLVVTLNTDNRLVSDTTLTDEYLRAHEHLGFTWEELREVTLTGFRSAFVSGNEKKVLVAEMEERVERI